MSQREAFHRARKLSVSGLLLAVACLGFPLAAQQPQGPPPGGAFQGPPGGAPPGPGGGPPTGPLQAHELTTTVYWVQGGVGNVGFVIGDKGVVVIDATISVDKAKELLADIAKVTPKPVTTVIITHGDTDHVGGLGAFPAGVTIIAQENTKKRLEQAVAAGRSRIPADHLPNRAVAQHEEVDLEGIKFDLLHWAPAHTSGDLVVFLPAQKIVFTGDIFALDQPRPLIHLDQQGTSAGWIASAQGIVALDADRFVVGHGEVQSKQALEQRVQQAIEERGQIEKLVSEGKTLAEVEAAVGDPPPGQSKSGAGGPRFEPYSQIVYQELTASK